MNLIWNLNLVFCAKTAFIQPFNQFNYLQENRTRGLQWVEIIAPSLIGYRSKLLDNFLTGRYH